MTYFMMSLAETVLLQTLRPMAKIAAKTVEVNLRLMAGHLFLTRGKRALADPSASVSYKQQILDKVESGGEFVWLAIYSPDGVLLTGSGNSPSSIADNGLLTAMSDTRNLAIGDASQRIGGSEIVMGVPLFYEGKLSYYLAGSYKRDALHSVLNDINISEQSTALIINDKNELIISRGAVQPSHYLAGSDFVLDGSALGKILSGMFNRNENGQAGSLKVQSKNGTMLFSFAPILGTRWLLLIASPQSDFNKVSQQAILTSVLITVLALALFSLAFTIFIRRSLTEPLITDHAKNLAEGNFESKFPPRFAENSNKAKSDFLSRMSHEMRTPMNAIRGMTSLAKSSSDIDRKDYCLSKIDEASMHLLGVINDVLDMSKIEANKFVLSPVPFDLKKELEKAVSVVNFSAEEKQISLSISIEETVPRFLVADNQRITQVVVNLLSNAVKFTPQYGFITLSVNLIEGDGESCVIQIQVADTGIGISAEEQARLFKTFEQADGGTTRKFGGTGLGLAISKKIVELMGGKIWVESDIGKGSKFIFNIRVKRHDGDTAPEAPGGGPSDTASHESTAPQSIISHNAASDSHADALEEGKNSFAGYRVLLAEDVEINREIVLALLEPSELSVDCAENGLIACDLFMAEPERYNLIFMDVNMPEMDGYDATRSIRALDSPWAKRIPIIAMTANVFKEDIEKCIEAGMNDHLGKPLEFEDVIAVLRKYLP